eukprot:g23184.t1
MGNAVDLAGLQAPKPQKKGRASSMVLVVGHIRKADQSGPESVAERRVEVWVQADKHATIGWVLSRVIEELTRKEPDAPSIVGLRVVKGGAKLDGESSVRGGSTARPVRAVGKRETAACGQTIRVLGTGASCRVVQVQHKLTGKQYAVKVLSKRKLVTHDKKLERAIAEKRVLSRLSHPFVVQMHWAFQTQGHLFLVLDYLESLHPDTGVCIGCRPLMSSPRRVTPPQRLPGSVAPSSPSEAHTPKEVWAGLFQQGMDLTFDGNPKFGPDGEPLDPSSEIDHTFGKPGLEQTFGQKRSQKVELKTTAWYHADSGRQQLDYLAQRNLQAICETVEEMKARGRCLTGKFTNDPEIMSDRKFQKVIPFPADMRQLIVPRERNDEEIRSPNTLERTGNASAKVQL